VNETIKKIYWIDSMPILIGSFTNSESACATKFILILPKLWTNNCQQQCIEYEYNPDKFIQNVGVKLITV